VALSGSLAARWRALSPLLDEALDLPEAERNVWLDNLAPEHADLKPKLRALLAGDPAWIEASVPARVVGVWRLLEKIGEGGMAEVWLAQRDDGLLGRPVAVKLPKIGFSDRLFCQRLAREREILDCLTHPNIARLLDAGTDCDGKPFLVLEFVDGEPIVEYCRGHALSIRRRLELFLQLAGAISFAHHSLVLHRDLKPSNILVTAGGTVHVLDFGIAKILDHGRAEDTDLTVAEGRALTLPYASPEQIAGWPLTVSSDVYSLGVVLYELLTGSRPHKLVPTALSNPSDMPSPLPPSAVTSDKPASRVLKGDLDNVLLMALKASAENRYQSVDAFKEDIQRYLERRPVLARPDSWWYCTRLCARRHRTAFLTAAALLCTLLISAILVAWQARLAHIQKRNAEAAKAIVLSMLFDTHSYWGNGKPLSALDVLKHAQRRLTMLPEADATTRVQVLNILCASLLSQQDTLAAEAAINSAMHSALQLPQQDSERLRSRLYKLWIDLYRGEIGTVRAGIESLLHDMALFGSAFPEDYAGGWRIRSTIAVEEGDAVKGLSSAEAALQIAESRLGVHHNQSVLGLVDLTYAYLSAGNHQRALQTGRQACARGLEAYANSASHPNVIKARVAYAQALAASGNPEAAIPLAKDAIGDTVALFGPSSLLEGLSLKKLAVMEAGAGRLQDAEKSIQRSCEILRTHFREGSPAYLALLNLYREIRSDKQIRGAPRGWARSGH
jgi:serine/threonine-protein kinase